VNPEDEVIDANAGDGKFIDMKETDEVSD